MRIDIILEPKASSDTFAELGLLAESYGMGAVWTANHDSARDPFMCFTHLARVSKNIRMGPIAISPFEYHPLKMANLLFALNEMSHGRTNIVVGGGGGTLDAMGGLDQYPPPNMVKGVRECVQVLKRVSPTELLTHEGEVFRIKRYLPNWATDTPPQIYVAGSRARMLKTGTKFADGIMMSDVTLPRLEESIGEVKEGLAENDRSIEDFHVNNLYAWHIKDTREEARDEAKRKIWVRGLLQRWYLEPFLDKEDCDLIESKQGLFAKSYFQNIPTVPGIPDSLMDKLVDNITLTGDMSDIDKQIEILKQFEAGGVTEFGFRLYENPADSIKTIGERIVPEFH